MPRPAGEEKARDEQEVIDVEDHQERQWHDAPVAQIVRPGDVEPAAAHHQEREAEHDAPADDVDGDFHETQMCGRMLHTANIVFISGKI